MEKEKFIWVVFIWFDQIIRIVWGSGWPIFVVSAMFLSVTGEKKIVPGKREFRVGVWAEAVLPSKMFDMATVENLTLTISAPQAPNHIFRVICGIDAPIWGLHTLKGEADLPLALGIQLFPFLGSIVIMIKTYRSGDSNPIQLVHGD